MSVKELIGAKVNYLRFSYQIDINLTYTDNVDQKTRYANIQIAAPFTFKADNRELIITPDDTRGAAPLLVLVHQTLHSVEVVNDILELAFEDGRQITIKPTKKFEAWNMSGEDIPMHIALPL